MRTKTFNSKVNGKYLIFHKYLKSIKISLILFLTLILNHSCITFSVTKYSTPKSHSTILPALKQLRTTLNPEIQYGKLSYITNKSVSDIESWKIPIMVEKCKKEIIEKASKEFSKLNSNPFSELFSRNNNINTDFINSITTSSINRNSLRPIINNSNFILYQGEFISDIEEIFQKKTNSIMEQDETKGFIVYELKDVKVKNPKFWLIPTVCTLLMSPLIGIPMDEVDNTISLEVTLYNKKFEKIKTYNSTKTKSAFTAMYWGYNGKGLSKDIYRAANAMAYSAALDDILEQIKKESDFINKELIKN